MANPDVLVLRWPDDDHRRPELVGLPQPTLLVLERGGLAPHRIGRYEDWLFDDAPPEEVALRASLLAGRAGQHTIPIIEDGLLRYGERWTALSEVQLPVAQLLVDRFERIVPKDEIQAAYAAAGGSVVHDAMRALVHRLARRVAEVDLAIRSVRNRGVILSAAPGDR